MNKKAFVLIAVVLASVLFIGGCTEQTTIRTAEDAGDAVTNVSTDIEDVSATLQDIDSTLGGG